jgi:excisionase family DNA binding protein
VLTVAELAVVLHCHKSTVYRMLRAHQLPAFKIGSEWRFHRDSIAEWLNRQGGDFGGPSGWNGKR